MMVERPERHIDDIARAGADSITVHVEATPHLHFALGAIREAGCTAGAAICPATPAEVLSEVAGDDARHGALHERQPRLGRRRSSSRTRCPSSSGCAPRCPTSVALEVDGGIHEATAEPVVRAGANLLVTGSAVFGSDDPAARLRGDRGGRRGA